MYSACSIRRARKAALPAVLAAVLLHAASCVAPLGPGYTVERKSMEVAYVSSGQPRVHVRTSWRMKNTGNGPLEALDVGVPGEERYGVTNLQAVVDGRAVSPAAVAGGALHITFEPPWAQNERREVIIEYELGKPAPYQGVTMETDFVILTGGGWYPTLRPPRGNFAKVLDEKPLDVAVRVPEGFRANSGGKTRGVRKDAGNLVYRFRAKKENGRLYVVAGRFFEQRFSRDTTTIVFWMLKAPWPQEQLNRAGARLADCLEAYENEFGALPGDKVEEPYRVVAVPSWPAQFVAGIPVFIAPGFTRGVVIPAQDESPEKANNYNLMVAAYELPEFWFGTPARTRSGAIPVFNMSLMQYAARFVGAEYFGGKPERAAAVRQTLQSFDHFARDPGSPKLPPLAAIAQNEERGERLLVLLKSELFLAALEDQCGQDGLRRALRHLAGTLGGTAYGYTELRSALESECHADLGPVFRAWLYETDIPAEFRHRYETPGRPSTP